MDNIDEELEALVWAHAEIIRMKAAISSIAGMPMGRQEQATAIESVRLRHMKLAGACAPLVRLINDVEKHGWDAIFDREITEQIANRKGPFG